MKDSKSEPLLGAGQIITGRWERNSYKIIRLLGRGGSSLVYLVKTSDGQIRAMKISTDLVAITHEHRILLYLNHQNKAGETEAIPAVYDLDDFQIGPKVFHFIIMQFCEGANLGKVRGRIGNKALCSIGLHTARFLMFLHTKGFVYGDLKPTNIVYDFSREATYIVDFGSVTAKGEAIKQYTPGYDRAGWHAGTRLADEQYDLFSLGIFLTTLVVGSLEGKSNQGLPGVLNLIQQRVKNQGLRKIIMQTLTGRTWASEVVKNLDPLVEQEIMNNGSRQIKVFVNIVGSLSLLSFILSLAYYLR